MSYRRILQIPKRSFFLFGPRGTGKSSLLKTHFKGAHYVDLLNERVYQALLGDVSLFAQQLNPLKRGSTIVVDEIQRLPHLLNEVQRFIEEKKHVFILSGSSARKLRNAGTNLLGGRASRRELFPLLPEELGNDFALERILRSGSIALIWSEGGQRDVLESYVQTYLKEEIQAEALVRNLPAFARFLPVAALFHGQVLNISALSRHAGVSRTTISGYLEVLKDTLLAFELRPFEGRLRVKEKKHPKLYWIDPGVVRAARRSFGPVQAEERGFLFEGWIASVLRAYSSYRQAFDEWNYWAPTESNALEVDFLLWQGSECIAIEAKATKRFRSEHLKGLNAFTDSHHRKAIKRRVVVYLGEEVLRTDSGVEVLPVNHFLEQVERGL